VVAALIRSVRRIEVSTAARTLGFDKEPSEKVQLSAKPLLISQKAAETGFTEKLII